MFIEIVCACACVRVHARLSNGARRPTRREQYTNASLFYIYKNEYDCIPYCAVTNTKLIITLTTNIGNNDL